MIQFVVSDFHTNPLMTESIVNPNLTHRFILGVTYSVKRQWNN